MRLRTLATQAIIALGAFALPSSRNLAHRIQNSGHDVEHLPPTKPLENTTRSGTLCGDECKDGGLYSANWAGAILSQDAVSATSVSLGQSIQAVLTSALTHRALSPS